MKKVLQNGYKYPQNSSTLLFSIDFIHLNALKFPKIVKNYYGAPPPPGLSKLVFRPFVFTSSFINVSSNFSSILNALSVRSNGRCHSRFDTISFASIGRLNKVSNNVSNNVIFEKSGYKFNVRCHSRFDMISFASIGRLNKVSNNVIFDKNGYKFNARCHSRFDKISGKSFVLVVCFTGKSFVYMFDMVMALPNGRIPRSRTTSGKKSCKMFVSLCS